MLREFLYVDVSRTRSLISQLDRGVVESVVERSTHGGSKDVFSAIGMGGLWKREDSAEIAQTRSVEDILFVAFEEAAEAEGLLRDLEADQPDAWENSSLHRSLEEGELVRISSDVLLLDPLFVKSRLERFMAVAESLRTMQLRAIEAQMAATRAELQDRIPEQAAGKGRDQRKNEERKLRRQIEEELDKAKTLALAALDGFNPEEIQPIADVLNSYLTSDAITVRALPCGRDNPSYSFVGSLLGRDAYIQRERDALFARYGSVVAGWTCVLQVAAVPSKEAALAARELDFSGLNLATGGAIDRAGLERTALDLLAMMDSLGLSEGPRWPAVSVVPLGIYRTVPRSLEAGSRRSGSMHR